MVTRRLGLREAPSVACHAGYKRDKLRSSGKEADVEISQTLLFATVSVHRGPVYVYRSVDCVKRESVDAKEESLKLCACVCMWVLTVIVHR